MPFPYEFLSFYTNCFILIYCLCIIIELDRDIYDIVYFPNRTISANLWQKYRKTVNYDFSKPARMKILGSSHFNIDLR